MKEKKYKILSGFLLAAFLFIASIPVWAEDDYDDEGLTDDQKAEADAYAGIFNPANYDDYSGMNWDNALASYYSAVNSYNAAIVSRDAEKIVEAERALHTAEEQIVMYADCHQDQYSISYASSGHGLTTTVSERATGEEILTTHAGDPVILRNGTLFLKNIDLSVSSYGMTFDLNRYYSTDTWMDDSSYGGVFGIKYNSILDSRLIRCNKDKDFGLARLKAKHKRVENLQNLLREMIDDKEDENSPKVVPVMANLYYKEYLEFCNAYDAFLKEYYWANKIGKNSWGPVKYMQDNYDDRTFIYMDEIGTPIIFDRSSDYQNVYECTYDKLRGKMQIVVGNGGVPIPGDSKSVDTEFPEAFESDEELDDIDIKQIIPSEELLKMKIPWLTVKSYENENNVFLRESEKLSSSGMEYFVKNIDGTVKVFNAKGLLVRIENSRGGKITLERNPADKVFKVVVNDSKEINFLYDGEGYLKEASCGAKKVKYTYRNYQIETFTDINGDTQKFSYDNYNLTMFTRGDGTYSTYNYSWSYEDGDDVTSYSAKVISTYNEKNYPENFTYETYKKSISGITGNFKNTTINCPVVTYADQDKVKTKVWFDEKGRNVKESTDDGFTKAFEWDDKNLLATVLAGNRTEFGYDENNNLISKLYGDGGKEQWTYEGQKVKSWTKKDGNVLEYGYDANGNLTSLLLNGTVVYRAVFGTKGELKRVYDQNEACKEFFYDDYGNVCKIETKGKDGKLLALERYGFDISGQIIWAEDFYGVRTDVSYGDHMVNYKSSTGLERVIYYSKRGVTEKEVLKDLNSGKIRVTDYTWDKCNNLVKVTVNGVVTEEYAYSKAGRIVSKKLAFDESKNYFYEYSWSNGQLVKATVCFADKKNVPLTPKKETSFENVWQLGERKFVVRDGNYTKTYFYDMYDRLKSLDINGVSGVENHYSQEGKLAEYKDGPKGFIKFNYDQWGNCTGIEEVEGVLAADFRKFNETGKLLSWIDRRGIVTNYSYNGAGNICESSSIQGKIWLDYENGFLTDKRIEDVHGKLLYEEKFEYFPQDRKTVVVQGGKYKTEILRNAFGQVEQISDGGGIRKFVYDEWGNCVEIIDGYGNRHCYKYNLDGSLAETKSPDGNIIEYEYDVMGNCVRAKDFNGDLFRGKYDTQGRIIESEKRPFSYVEKFEYDELNRVVKVTHGNTVVLTTDYNDVAGQKIETDSAGNKIIYETDGFSRIRKITDRLGAVKELSFGHDGSVQLCSDFEKSVTEYSFSDDGLELLIKYSDGTFVKQKKDFAGRIVKIENESGSQMYEYDTGGKLIRQIDGFTGKEVVYQWNVRGLLENVRGAGRNTTYVYGKNREILKVVEVNETYGSKSVTVLNEEYDNCGRLIREKFETGEEQRYEYDRGGRLVLTSGYDAVGKVVFVEGKIYDKNGFVSMVLNSDFTVTRYEYDEMGRLAKTQYVYNDANRKMFSDLCLKTGIYNAGIEAKVKRVSFSSEEIEKLNRLVRKVSLGQYQLQRLYDVFDESYKYDSRGNMIERCTPYGIVSYKYDKENRLVSWGYGAAAVYDGNGNLIFQKDSISESNFTYSKVNRIKDVKITNFLDESVEVAGFGYDGFGRRNYETRKSGSYKTTYEGLSFKELFVEFNPSLYEESAGKLYAGNGYRYSETSVNAEKMNESSKQHGSYAPMYGARSTPVALLHYSGNETTSDRLYSDSHGTVGAEVQAGTGITKSHEYDVFGKPVSAEVQYGFCGKKYDETTQLYDFGYRHYDPVMIRFSSVDPLRDGYNWYAYCNYDSVNFMDPYGLKVTGTSEMHMQDFGSTIVGNSTDKTDTMETVGCLVTAFAEVMSALYGTTVTPDDINNIKEAFAKGSANMLMTDMAASFGASISVTTAAQIMEQLGLDPATGKFKDQTMGMLKVAGLSLYKETRDPYATGLYQVLSEYYEDDNFWALIAEVKYSADGHTHFVTLAGNVFSQNGKAYVPIVPTSKNDRNVAKGSMRAGAGWIIVNGRVCVPAKNVVRIVAVEK